MRDFREILKARNRLKDYSKADKLLEQVLQICGVSQYKDYSSNFNANSESRGRTEAKQRSDSKQGQANKRRNTITKSHRLIKDLYDLVMDQYAFKTLEDTKEILRYDDVDGKYHFDGETVLRARLESETENDISNADKNEVITHVRDSTYVKREEFDKDMDLMHFYNGYYNVKTMQFEPGHSPSKLSLMSIPHDYNPEATCPKITAYIEDVLQKDQQAITTVKKMLGYCFLEEYEIR